MNIIFDLDGTLFQTDRCVINAVNELCRRNELGIVSEEMMKENIGKRSADFLGRILPADVDPNAFYEEYSLLERNEISKNAQLYKNVVKLLSELKEKGHHLFVCSNGSKEYIDLVLNKTHSAQYFDEVYSAKYISKGEVVKKIIGDGSISTIMVGDTNTDLDAALENKVPFIGVTYGYGDEKQLGSEANFLAASVMELEKRISEGAFYFHVLKNIELAGARIIGINGVDTSGKTSFTLKLAKFLKSRGKKVQILHIDDFHNPRSVRTSGTTEIDAYYNNAFNYEQVISEILEPLKTEGKIDKEVRCLDLETDQYEKMVEYKIDRETILLIEGVLLFRQPLEKYLDYKIYIHISFEEVLKRARVRDVPLYGEAMMDKYISKYIPIQQRYISENCPQKTCDLLINNEDFSQPYICNEEDL